MSASLLRANAIALPLADESVDLIVTSPPYFALRSYQDGGEHFDGQIGSEPTPQDFLDALWAVTEECRRVLKPSGSMFVNLGDKYAGSGGHNNSGISPKSTLQGNGHVGGVGKAGQNKIKATPRHPNGGGADRRAAQREASRRQAPDAYNKATIGGARPKSLMGLPWRYALGCVDQLDLILRAEIVWSKPNGLPESVKDRVRRSHEQWFHLTKQGDYFADLDAVREPASGYQRNAAARATPPGQRKRAMADTVNPAGPLPPSVWTVATEPLTVPAHLGVDHFAAFPQEWPRRFILGWAPKDGVVLDPFGGTGTTAMVARALGRFGVHVDLSRDYLRLARWRVFESRHALKSVARTTREAQGALDLGGVA